MNVEVILKVKGYDMYIIFEMIIVDEVMKVLKKYCVGVVIVLDGQSQVSGVFLECDFVCFIVEYSVVILNDRVVDYMMCEVYVCWLNYLIDDFMVMMINCCIWYLFVIEGG